MVGPSRLLGLPETSGVMMMIGLAILGLGAAFTVIPVIPEMLDSVDGMYEEHRSEISDNFSGIFNVAGGFGQIVGPSIAGAMNDKIGFNWTFDTIALIIIGYNLIYIIFCGGLGSIGRSVKATALRCRKQKGQDEVSDAVTSSPKRKLLENEESEDQTESDVDEKEKDFDEMNGMNRSNVSTDISYGAIN